MSSKDARGDKGASTGKRLGGNKKMSGAKLSAGSKGTGGGKKAAGRPHRGGKTKSQASSRQRTGRPSHRGASFDASALEGAEFIEVSNVALPLDVGLESPASEVNRPTPVPLSTETNHPAPATPAASPAPAEGSHAESLSRAAIASALGVAPEDVASFSLVKRSVDARKKSNVHFNATYAVHLAQGVAYDALSPARGVNVRAYDPPAPLAIPDLRSLATSSDGRIVVAGTGPAGLFCALYLAEAGLRPLVVERGAAVDERTAAIESFNAGGPLDAAANVQFGEGGAGTFSDGKLTTGTKSPHIRHVLEAFVQAGAPDEILWQAKPHIGTDKLPAVVKSIRERIISAGGEVRFLTRLADIELSDGAVCSVALEDSRTGAREVVEASRVIVACGHSARDIFELARDRGFALERKPFSMGVRIEHPQTLINRAQYGAAAKHAALGAADYKMAVRVPARANGTRPDAASENATRGVYTFCMCPGGEVVAAASEEGGVVVNGMSRFARDGENSNSALLADVRPDDLPGNDVMEGVRLQREVEHAAFELARRNGGVPYAAPAQTVGDFLVGATSSSGQAEGKQPGGTVAAASEARRRTVVPGPHRRRTVAPEPYSRLVVHPSYPRGVVWCDLRECLPEFICGALAQGLPLLDAKLHGFADPTAVLTGPETRSSSPIRMVRGENFQARLASDSPDSDEEPATRVYPCGEGAGYAGGIMSAAVDGLRVAEAIAAEFSSR
ncbi:NAD(P)/FAD-dependent oxidoreductase [Ellagibacter isourolithinifaciens]|uniref:NAD(P)/FAD-dependent oxidoreductase n=1 Tax=Ellagibacter isourolithinifaciens TaxID=2137581 RepID=UPI003AF1C94A